MKYINKHEKNLISIKCDDILINNNFFVEILDSFQKECKGVFYIEGSRETYECETNTLKCRIEEVIENGKILQYSDFGMEMKGLHMNSELLSILWRFWFAYEHVMFCFFIEDINVIDLKRKNWSQITELYKSYVLFKGIEDDVIWIGKSEELSFD